MRKDRAKIFDTVEVPVSALYAPEFITKDMLPSINRLSDKQLEILAEIPMTEAKLEQERRAQFVLECKNNGRAYYLFKHPYPNPNAGDAYVLDRTPKEKFRWKRDQHVMTVKSPNEVKNYARLYFDRYDKGAVVIKQLESDYWDKDFPAVFYYWPNECKSLAETGKHNWNYVPTGDDVCSDCGLVV